MKLPKVNISKILNKHLSLVKIYPKAIFTKSDSYDPFRKEEIDNYNKTGHNYIPLKTYVRSASPSGLIVREIGLKALGSKELWVNKKYISLIKNSEQIIIDGEKYSVWSKAVGNRFQLFERKGNLNVVQILIFKQEIQ